MLSFANVPGAIFNVWGACGSLIDQIGSYQSYQNTNLTGSLTGLIGQLSSQPDIQAIAGNSYLGVLGGPETAGTLAQQIASHIANRLVYQDNPQLSQSTTQVNLNTSILEIIRQMKLAGATVRAMIVTAAPTAFTGAGNGIVVASVNRPLDGKVLENAFAENLLLLCTRDSIVGGAQSGSETIAVTGTGSEPDPFAWDWPLGSNCSSSLISVDGNSTGRNLLNNSGFETWTSNTPKNWNITIGASSIFKESSLIYDGTAALRLQGDGSTLTSWQQQFGVSGSLNLAPLTQYSFNVFIRSGGSIPSTGILQVDLIDGGGNITKDAAGVANSFTIDLTGLNTQYASFTGVFRTPMLLPSNGIFLRFHLTTAISNGSNVYIDKASFGQMIQLYTSGPFINVHSGSNPFNQGDFANCQIQNSRGGGGTLNTFQTIFARLFWSQVLSNEWLLPSSSTPTISDQLAMGAVPRIEVVKTTCCPKGTLRTLVITTTYGTSGCISGYLPDETPIYMGYDNSKEEWIGQYNMAVNAPGNSGWSKFELYCYPAGTPGGWPDDAWQLKVSCLVSGWGTLCVDKNWFFRPATPPPSVLWSGNVFYCNPPSSFECVGRIQLPSCCCTNFGVSSLSSSGTVTPPAF
jgi:hypothetical protein